MFRLESFPPRLSRYTSEAVKMLTKLTPQFTLPFVASKRYRWIAVAIFLVIFIFFLLQTRTPLVQNIPSIHTAADVDWSRFAYTQYVTNSEYLCNSVMFFEALHRLSSRADRVMMYPSRMLESEEGSPDARLLLKARDEYNVKLVPITVQHRNNADGELLLSIDVAST